MRITIDLDSVALERAKLLAQRDNKSLGAVISQAVTAYVTTQLNAEADAPFELIVRGKAGSRFPSSADIALVEADEDLESLCVPRGRNAR